MASRQDRVGTAFVDAARLAVQLDHRGDLRGALAQYLKTLELILAARQGAKGAKEREILLKKARARARPEGRLAGDSCVSLCAGMSSMLLLLLRLSSCGAAAVR